MKFAKPLTEDQQKFIIENRTSMTVQNICFALDLKSTFRIYKFLQDSGIENPKKKELTEDQKKYIVENYKCSTNEAMRRFLHLPNTHLLCKFMKQEGLTEDHADDNKEDRPSNEVFFNVNELKYGWIM